MVEKAYLQKTGKPVSIIYLLLSLAISNNLFSQTDTAAKKVKTPKHYFVPTFFIDYYGTPSQDLSPKDLKGNESIIGKQLKDYQYAQSVGGFYIPILTKDKVHKDQRTSNFHLLITGSYMLAMPRFSGISDHNLMKASVGFRTIYNTGKKGIWFFDATPFVAGDLADQSTMVTRWASTFVYDRMVSDKFSYRVGFTRTFMLGNRYNLPYLGMRLGRLDGIYLSIQFPRFISFSFPMGPKLRGSVYTKVQGSLLAMANTDSLYNGVNNVGQTDKTIIFGRYEGNSGMRMDFTATKHFSLFAALGTSSFRGMALFSRQFNKKNKTEELAPFFGQKLAPTIYLNVGLTFRFGQAKSIYNNYTMYEVFNANTTIDVGDNNTDTGDGNIPNQTKKKKISNLKTRDVQDLIEAQDLY